MEKRKKRKLDFTNKEQKQIKEFIEKHNKSCKLLYSSTNGYPKYSYIYTPFGLGPLKGIRCNICKTEEDITDTDIW